jgi:ABC-type Mn2+/Zn2+ transport system permease subunit
VDQFLLYLHLMKYPLMVGPLMAGSCALLSVFVVLRGMAMISEGVAHAGVAGLSLAILIGYFVGSLNNVLSQNLITACFCVGAALAMGYLTRGGKVSHDASIGIVLVSTLSLGIVILSIRQGLGGHGDAPPPSIETLLFGDILTVGAYEMWLAAGLAVIVFGVIFSMYNAFVYTALDEEMARINGVPVKLINTLLLVLVSLAIVVSVRLVGGILVNAFIIIPGATARMLGRRFGLVVLLALVVGVIGTTAGLALAIGLALQPNPMLTAIPAGPVLVLVLFLVFLAVWVVRQVRKPKVAEDAIPAASDGHGH